MKFSAYMYSAQEKLLAAGLPINDLNILAEHVLQKDFQTILIEDPEISDYLQELETLLNQVVNKSIPIAYLVGFEYFYGRKIFVNENCLIPRTETEELVFNTIEFIKSNFKAESKLSIADVCTGSGIVGLSIYLELQSIYEIDLYVSDISKAAIEVCQKNMENYQIAANYLIGDSLEPFLAIDKKFDIVVANPPYIPSEEFVADIVKKYEPNIALFGGIKGSEIHLQIIKNLTKILKDKYFVGFELGEGQGDIIMSYAKEYCNVVNIWKNYDMFSRERNVFFTNMELNDN